MNKYTVLKEFTDPIEGLKPVGSIVTLEPSRGAKLKKMGYVTLLDEYVEKLVDLRWNNESLEVYNKLTGNVLLRIPPAGLTSLALDIIGNLTGDVTGNVAGNLTGQVFGQVSTYVADGAIGITDNHVILNSNGGTCNMTLADGTEGQVITIKAVDVSNACTVTPAHFNDGTTITFTDQYSAVTLICDGGGNWNVGGTYKTVNVA